MEENIFEGAKFGDKFLTRNGDAALYLDEGLDTESNKCHVLQIEKATYYTFCTNEGKDVNYILTDNNCHSDIVSRYHEQINEDKLNEISVKESIRIIDRIDKEICLSDIIELMSLAYKTGYNNAKN